MDIVALGRAQRQIQTIVEESLQHKKMGTRTKIARWQHSPRPAEANSQQPAQLITSPTTELSAPPPLDFDLQLDPEKLAAAGWQVSYPQAQTGPKVGTDE